MEYKAKCWYLGHWVYFTVAPGLYNNIIIFLNFQDIQFLSEMQLDFSTIPLSLHGRGRSFNLLDYLSKNGENYSLVSAFLYYFVDVISKISYADGTKLNFYFPPSPWQNLEINIKGHGIIVPLTVDSTFYSVDDETITSDQTEIFI